MPIQGVPDPPSEQEWNNVFDRLKANRGIQDDMSEDFEMIRASGSRAMYHELLADNKQLGLSTFANIVTACNSDDQVRKVLMSVHSGGKHAANLKLIELTGYDLKGNPAAN